MIAYVDASVLLRVALRQPDALPEWRHIEQGIASALILTESMRTLDRLRLRANLSDEDVATRRATTFRLIASLELVELDEIALSARRSRCRRSSEPWMPCISPPPCSGGRCRASISSWPLTIGPWGWRHAHTAFPWLGFPAEHLRRIESRRLLNRPSIDRHGRLRVFFIGHSRRRHQQRAQHARK